MHNIYKLKDMLCEELEKYGAKSELSGGTLEIIDKLAHAIKNIDKIIQASEEEEQGSYYGPYDAGMGGTSYRYSRNGMGGGSYTNGGSYRGYSRARGRGANANRDSMGRYSSAGDMAEQLRALIADAPNDQIRQEMQALVNRVEQQM